jgi:Diacylglycerol kinase catalytic domain
MPSSFEIRILIFIPLRNACQIGFGRIICEEKRMRITLIHNPTAGRGKHDKKELIAALAKVGHHATYQSTKKSDYKKALKRPTDLVLVVGADGTVAKVACRLIDTGIPLSVLPLGTANNLARSLGFVASPEEIIARIQGGKKRAFDVGVIRGRRGTRYFLRRWAAVCSRIMFGPQKPKVRKPKRFPRSRKWLGMFGCCTECFMVTRHSAGRSTSTAKTSPAGTYFGKR